MYNRSTASDELEAYLKRLQPGLSYGEALAKHASDEVVQGLYADYQSAREDPEPESAGVRKAQEDAAQPGAGIWSTIEKLAAKLRAEQPGVLSEAESIERICFRERPDLYRAYREATME